MTHKAPKHQDLERFLRTVDLLTAAAMADLDAERKTAFRPWTTAFEVELLAAAGAEGVSLPQSEILAEGNELSAIVTHKDQCLFVKLQLLGFAALDRYGGREARLVSSDGAIDYRLCFSASGSANCVLTGSADIRASLSRFEVRFQEEPDADSVPDES